MKEVIPLPNQQADNFITVLRAACGNGKKPLQSPDWDQLAEWARTQSLTALFYTGATQYEEFQQWDAAKRQKMQRETISIVATQAQRTQRFLDLYRQLCVGGLHPLVLKGIDCRSLYGDLADYRPSCDEDLYIPPAQIEHGYALLKECGFVLASHEAGLERADEMQEISFDDTSGILHLELHPTLFGTDRPDLDRATRWFSNADIERRAVSVELYGETFYTLHPTDHYLYLYLHLAKHFCATGVGLRQIMDLAKFQLAYRDEIDWPTIKKAVETLNSPVLYADVMAVARRFGFAVQSLTGREHNPDALVADSLSGGVYGHDREGNGTGALLSAAAMYPGRLQKIRRVFFPSAQQLEASRPYLVKRPWLLPLAWIDRYRKLIRTRGFGRETQVSIQVAQQRIRLLKSYGLLPSSGR